MDDIEMAKMYCIRVNHMLEGVDFHIHKIVNSVEMDVALWFNPETGVMIVGKAGPFWEGKKETGK